MYKNSKNNCAKYGRLAILGMRRVEGFFNAMQGEKTADKAYSAHVYYPPNHQIYDSLFHCLVVIVIEGLFHFLSRLPVLMSFFPTRTYKFVSALF